MSQKYGSVADNAIAKCCDFDSDFIIFVVMNSKIVRFVLISSALISLAGCKMHQGTPRPTIPIVEDILSDPQCKEYRMLAGLGAYWTRGDIVLVDEPSRCFYLSERFIRCDDRDNMDASPKHDFLPDFSGERITSLIDIKFTPYSSYVSAGNDGALRELAVRSLLAAVDTVCSLGPYDHEFKSVKPSAKVIVFSSPHLASFARFDLDTLVRSTASPLALIFGPEVMIGKVIDRHGPGACMGFVAPADVIASGAYSNAFREVAAKRGDVVSRLVDLKPAEKSRFADSLSRPAQTDPLKVWLDNFVATGVKMPLSALIVDDYSVSADSLRASYKALIDNPSVENAFYRKLLSKDFEIVDGVKVITDTCYNYLRKHNLFTHNIAYPQADAFMTSPEEKGYVLMDFDINDLPVELIGEMERTAPKTNRLYVQDQYYGRGN